MCPLFFFSLPSQHALTLLDLYIVGIHAEFEVYDLLGMCNLALRE